MPLRVLPHPRRPWGSPPYRGLKKFFAVDIPSAVRHAILNNTNAYQSFAFVNMGFVYQMSFPLITEP
jgi:hypothetical protein